jgi:polysaccharide export outer membrane protein
MALNLCLFRGRIRMPLRRLLVVTLAVLALAACARQVPRYAQAPQSQSELDALAYGAPGQRAGGAYRAAHPAAARTAQAQAAMAMAMAGESGPYTLDSGDKLRVVVFGQDAISNTYAVDASGKVTLPLIGGVPARGLTTAQLSGAIASRLRQSYIRDPSVAVEIDTYRPFFVLGEVTYPGQYPYVPNMTVETAIAIAGGFTPRAWKDRVTVTRSLQGEKARYSMPLQYPVRPGDTIVVAERWF